MTPPHTTPKGKNKAVDPKPTVDVHPLHDARLEPPELPGPETAPRGQGQGRRQGPPTELLPPVTVTPEFKTNHVCSKLPTGARVLQIPPKGWILQILRVRVHLIRFCPFCGERLHINVEDPKR